MKLQKIPLDHLEEPTHDARSWVSKEGLEELAASIKRRGVLLPLRVFKNEDKYEIQDGHRRYLAARQVGLVSVPCLIVKTKEDGNELDKLHANLDREEISPLDLGRMLAHLKTNYSYTDEMLTQAIGKSVSRVIQLVSLSKLDKPILEALEDKRIGEHIARSLMQISDKEKRKYYLKYCLDGGATIQTVRAWVQREKGDTTPPPKYEPTKLPPEQEDIPVNHKCNCAWCNFKYDSNQMLMLQCCPECWSNAKKLFKQTREEAKEEITGEVNKNEESSSRGGD